MHNRCAAHPGVGERTSFRLKEKIFMAKNVNAASRLHVILTQAAGMSSNATSLAIWENVFQIQEIPTDARKALIIPERLRWLHLQLDILRSQMREANFSENLYSVALNNIELAISTLLLSTTWNNGLQYLKPETLIALEFCSEILPDEESIIDATSLEEIRSLVQELEDSLQTTTLPPSLISIILHHIELIKRALDQYPIIGAKALREVSRTAIGELIESKDIIKDNNSTSEVNQLGKIWSKLNNMADIAIKADKLTQIGTKAWAFLEKFEILTP
jgi:hypothetical protein